MIKPNLNGRGFVAALAAVLMFGAAPALAASPAGALHNTVPATLAAPSDGALVLADSRREVRREVRRDFLSDRREDRRDFRAERREDRREWRRDQREDRREFRREWRRGHYLPARGWRAYPNWRRHGWRRPPQGYHYVQYDGRYFLAAIATGVILDVLH